MFSIDFQGLTFCKKIEIESKIKDTSFKNKKKSESTFSPLLDVFIVYGNYSVF